MWFFGKYHFSRQINQPKRRLLENESTADEA